MATLLLTVCPNDHYFMEYIVLADKTNSVSIDMGEDNLKNVMRLLPEKHRDKQLIQITSIHDLVHVDLEDIQDD